MGCRLEEREKEKGGRASERLGSRIAGGSKRGGNIRNRRKDDWTQKTENEERGALEMS